MLDEFHLSTLTQPEGNMRCYLELTEPRLSDGFQFLDFHADLRVSVPTCEYEKCYDVWLHGKQGSAVEVAPTFYTYKDCLDFCIAFDGTFDADGLRMWKYDSEELALDYSLLFLGAQDLVLTVLKEAIESTDCVLGTAKFDLDAYPLICRKFLQAHSLTPCGHECH